MTQSNRRRIVLVRHGHSAHTTNAGWIDGAGVHRWREAYDAAGILANSVPPPALIALTASADCVVSSDLTRALASADRLAPGRERLVSPLLREMHLHVPGWVRARWPLPVWEVCIHLHWLGQQFGGSAIASTEELQRAATAVDWLEERSREAATMVVITHGAFRRLLGRRFVETGWTAEPRVGGYSNWSAWGYARREA